MSSIKSLSLPPMGGGGVGVPVLFRDVIPLLRGGDGLGGNRVSSSELSADTSLLNCLPVVHVEGSVYERVHGASQKHFAAIRIE